MILSDILNHVLVRDIGLCWAGDLGCLGSFGRRMIVAYPSSFGMLFSCHMCDMSLYVISSVIFPPAFSASAHIWSGPGALLFVRFLIIERTLSLVGGVVLCYSSVGLSAA